MSNKILKFPVLFSLIALLVTSCARNLSSNTYVDSSTAGVVYEGTIISARQVTVKDSDKLGEKPGLGTLGGGALGGIAASNIGKGKGSAASSVGGAVAGAVLGTWLQDQLSTQQGMEYIVKISEDNLDNVEKNYNSTKLTNPSVSEKITGSAKIGLKTKTISVVQGADTVFTPGQKVYVIYNDDRPRITPR